MLSVVIGSVVSHKTKFSSGVTLLFPDGQLRFEAPQC